MQCLIINNKILKFLLVGCVNTSSSFLSFILLNELISYRLAFFASYVVGIVTSYFLNGKWTFSAKLSIRSFFLYPLVYIVQLLAGWVGLECSVQYLKLSELVSYIVSLLFSIPIGFISVKWFFGSMVPDVRKI